MSFELVSYADLKNLLGLTKAAIGDYPAMGVLVTSVQYAIEEELGRLLENDDRTATIYVDSIPTQMIYLPAIPIVSVTSVTITQAQTDTVYAATDYDLMDYGIKLYSKLQHAKIVVVYNGGLESADVPTSINRAALMQTAYEWQAKDQIGAESVSTEGGFVKRPELGLLKEVKRMLSSQKHPLRIR